MTDIGKRIREQREAIHMTQEELAVRLGYKNKSSIAKIETGVNDIAQSKIAQFAEALNTTVASLMGWSTSLGSLANDTPFKKDSAVMAEEITSAGDFFGLQIHDDSMEPRIIEGDVVIVRRQDEAESGDTVIAIINENNTACKRLQKYADGIMLLSTNPKYEPLVFTKQQIHDKSVKIIGRVMELRAKF